MEEVLRLSEEMACGLSPFCDCGMDCIVIMADTVDNCIDSLEKYYNNPEDGCG